MNDTAIIALKNGGLTVVDSDLFEWLNQWKWQPTPEGYACRYERVQKGKYKKIYLHSLINGTPQGLRTDHKNGIKLDNRRQNLRTADRFQNARNSVKHQRGKPSSQYKGVYWSKTENKWKACIRFNGKSKGLGTFVDEIEAAKAYNRCAKDIHGEFARLNPVPEHGN